MEEEMTQISSSDDKAWKWSIRKRVWDLMESENIAENPYPIHPVQYFETLLRVSFIYCKNMEANAGLVASSHKRNEFVRIRHEGEVVAYFNAPGGDEPLALDLGSMGKGQVWINGESIGRYWTAAANGDCNHCSYAGTYRAPKCQTGCGQPTQRWYHVPRSWLQPTKNLLVIFEEIGGDASGISLVKRSVSSVCADVSEWHPTIKNWHIESYGRSEELHRPKVNLRCAMGQSISAIKFASFGTPLGTCGSFQQGPCHSPNSHDILEKKCIGQQRCGETISMNNFGGDPFPNVMKRVAVEAVCTSTEQPN